MIPGSDGSFRIIFELEIDEDGWPPVGTERIWATLVDEVTADDKYNTNAMTKKAIYRVDNIPFFIPLLAYKDLIEAEEKEGSLFFVKLVKRSQHSTVRIIFLETTIIEDVLSKLRALGCELEMAEMYKHLTTVDIPIDVSFLAVRTYLAELENNGLIDFQESLISEHHNKEIVN
ncbi:MAG: DUF4265 domain-containing protein [Alphaproteobacteria bacterium]|nr:DUF4265 domain-containing protein [Alphaproteobacteria bacterium]